MKLNLRIIESDSHYLKQVVNLHKKNFPHRVMSLLGDSMMTCLFRFFAMSPLGLFIIIESKERVIGYVVGSLDRDRFWRLFLVKKFHVITWHIILKSIQDLDFIKLIFARMKIIFRIPEKNKKGWKINYVPRASLLWIVVDKRYRNKGVGYKLNEAFFNQLRKNGCTSVKLGVSLENVQAYHSYIKAGWKVAFQGEESIIMVAEL